MSESTNAWDEVGARFQGLGRKLKAHLEHEREGESAEEATQEVKAALSKLVDSLDDAFEALGNAARDPSVRQDVADTGRSLVGAIGVSLEQVGDEIRRATDRRRGGEGPDAGGEAQDGTSAPGT
jgi:hypothetical protein